MSDDDQDAPGPDERDMDLLDGSWEKRHYSGEIRQRDWQSIGIGITLLVLIALILPAIFVFVR